MRRFRYFTAAASVAVLLLTGCTGTADPSAPPSSPSAIPTGTASASSTGSPSATPPAVLAKLARIPWDGGPDFYKKFSKADAAGWGDPGFFPIGVWYASGNGEQLQFDKAHGINFYVQLNPDTDYALFDQYGMFSLMKVKNAPDAWAQLPGNYVDDEVDGRFGWDEGVVHMNQTIAELKAKEEGRFTYANWTPSLISYDAPMDITKRYWETVDVASTSNYYYAGACREWRLRTPQGYNPTTTATCQTSSAYGESHAGDAGGQRRKGCVLAHLDGPDRA
ncbi:hypothetical protein AB4Y87_00415 [Paenarthrobacter sp. RAF54_2]|uniref:hypothetical protein n=1 Tax=Paenarthrobacter sp. RAF54_2 TaxID=3233061 RepID=UPI003F9DBC47